MDIRYYICLWNLRPFLCFFLPSSSLALLALFMNNLCISLFMNDLNMDPSLNLIIKNHTLASFWFHLYPSHWHLWNGTRFNRFFFCFICVCSVSIFTLFCVFCFCVLGVLSISFRLAILFGVLLRKPYESHFSYNWNFLGAWKTMRTTSKSLEKRYLGLIIVRRLVLWMFWLELLLCL